MVPAAQVPLIVGDPDPLFKPEGRQKPPHAVDIRHVDALFIADVGHRVVQEVPGLILDVVLILAAEQAVDQLQRALPGGAGGHLRGVDGALGLDGVQVVVLDKGFLELVEVLDAKTHSGGEI